MLRGKGRHDGISSALRPALLGLAAIALLSAAPGRRSTGELRDRDWPIYGGSAAGDRYSDLAQVDASNVGRLQQVWRHDTGAGGLQTSPLVVGKFLYGVTPRQGVFALDAASGRRIWEYAPPGSGEQPVRGLSYWAKGKERRLFSGEGTYLLALDPRTGKPVPAFGKGGRVDLREGLGRDPAGLATFLTTPGVIFGDLIIVGFRTSESPPAAPGAVRAYDARTGKLAWTFNTIPRQGEHGHESWPAAALATAGGANAWAGMVVDEKRGILFVPTGSAVDDFYGGDRIGDNLFANSLIALDARTGKRLWHFQAVHHDLLDRDFPSPPVLLTVNRNGKPIDAVAQPTKHGFLFVFNRVTGEALFSVEEKPVPPSEVPGEKSSPTQPFPLKPLPYARQRLTAEMLTRRTPEAHAFALWSFAGMRSDGPFAPLGLGRQTIVFPGFDGGAEWGGPAVDRKRAIIYINSNDLAWTGGLAASGGSTELPAGLYAQHCSACHGLDRQGSPPQFPPLTNAASHLSRADIAAVVRQGRGRMPGFPQLSEAQIETLAAYLLGGAEAKREAQAPAGNRRYAFTGYRKFLDPDGYPAVAPPWGTLNAIDLNSGDYVWKIPLGEYPELVATGQADTGSENYGGPLVTAGNLLFIGATLFDQKFRAFDSLTGKLLWETRLPFSGMAAPITYAVGGRQFVVIATSNARNPKGQPGSAYVAYALPDQGGR